jgi:Replication-relaxation
VARILRRRNPTPNDLRTTKRTLLLLNKEKMLNRVRFPNLNDDGNPYVYGLSERAVLEYGGKEFNENKRTLDHELEISDFHIALHEYCDEHGIILYWQQTDLKKGIHPDAYFSLTKNGETKHFFLEIERQAIIVKDGKPTIQKKLDRYYDYYDSDECEDRWGFRRFRIITLQETALRRQHVLPLLEKNRMFWMGLSNTPTSDFRTPKGDTYSLSDL